MRRSERPAGEMVASADRQKRDRSECNLEKKVSLLNNETVERCGDYAIPFVLTDKTEFIYNADAPPDCKYRELGKCLAQFGDLFRSPYHGSGLVLVVVGDRPEAKPIRAANE